MDGDITEIEGVLVGHAQDTRGLTGCTVVIVEQGAVGGSDVRGTASGTRQMDSLGPLHLVERIQAVLFCGGSAFGLEAAGGVMRYLEEKGMGFRTPIRTIPIVPTAVIFDLSLGDPRAHPTPEMAYRACQEASAGPLLQGSVGVGIGASVGKYHGIGRAMKGGLGSACQRTQGGILVGALAVVNAFGDVVDPSTGEILAGLRAEAGGMDLSGTVREMIQGVPREGGLLEHTTLVLVATDAELDKVHCCRLARMAQGGLAQCISPSLCPVDGDVVIALSTGHKKGDFGALGAAAQRVTVQAVLRAIRSADGLGVLPAWRDRVRQRATERP